MSDEKKKIIVTEVRADGSIVDKSGPPIFQKKARATDTLTPNQIEELIKSKQKKEVPDASEGAG